MLFPSFFNAAAGGYEIEQSLRFDRASSHYLNETFSAGQTTWTVSFWVKRANLNGVVQCLFGTSTNGFYNDLGFEGSDRLRFRQVYSGVPSENFEMVSTMRFRDPSAWYHIVLSYGAHDGSAAADRAKIWVNNQRLTAFDTANYPGANVSSLLNANNRVHNIGKVGFYDDYLGAYIAEFNFIDGQRLDPTDFGEEDNNGVWRPIKFAGTYGNNNSVYLKFDPTATNGIGHDHSGNGNHWSPSGFTTSGTGTDVLADTPTNNFCTWNPLDNTGVTLKNGNLDFGYAGAQDCGGTFALSSGKWYWEIEVRDDIGGGGQPLAHGIHNASVTSDFRKQAIWFYTDEISAGVVRRYANNSVAASVSIPSALRAIDIGDYLQVAYDAGSGEIWFGVNNTWMDGSGGTSGDPGAGSNPVFTLPDTSIPMTPWRSHAGLGWKGYTNFGQRDYQYTPPTGFNSVCTSNLPAPTVKDGSKYFDTALWTNTTDVSSLSFQPDLVWVKGRSYTSDQCLTDSVRGVDAILCSSDNGAESLRSASWRSSYGQISSFDNDGFTISTGSDAANSAFNRTNNTQVAWNWKANGSGSSNTDGSITSTVSVNPTAGFSIVTYTGTGVNATVGHGLGVQPSFYVVKPRSYANNWPCWHKDLTSDGYYIHLNHPLKQDLATAVWNGTGPSSTVFNIGTNTNVNQLDATFVAYVFAEVEGYSKISSYAGNGVIDGPFVYCGFRPAFVLIKNYRGGSETNWIMRDSARSPYNKVHPSIYANTTAAEINNFDMDFLSNGFKIKDDNAVFNESGSDYLFLAFAENPFGGSGVSPATAR